MTEGAHGINSVADKRYYHFVALNSGGVSLAKYWRLLATIGEVVRPNVVVPPVSSRFTVEHRKLRLDKAYGRGIVMQALSEQGRGRPPYLYDLFAAKIDVAGNQFVLLGFPFAALARDIVDVFTGERLARDVEFQGVDLSMLLSQKNRPLQRFEGLMSRIVGVQFVVTDDKSLTSVRLGGENPFQAKIYEFFLKRKFEEGLWVPDQCVLACELEAGSGILRSRLHIDKAGNFKFYMHAACTNVTLMPNAIAQIQTAACFKQVFGNPLRKAEQDDGD